MERVRLNPKVAEKLLEDNKKKIHLRYFQRVEYLRLIVALEVVYSKLLNNGNGKG